MNIKRIFKFNKNYKISKNYNNFLSRSKYSSSKQKRTKFINQKILLIFDMDNTILKETTDYEVIKLLPAEKMSSIKEPWQNWAKYMQEVYKKMKEESIKIEDIKKCVLDIELNEGFLEVFEMIRSNRDKIETLIISGANTLYIQWIIEHYKLTDVFDGYFSNLAEPDEESLIKVSPNHLHECPICLHSDISQCKKKVIEDYFILKGIKPNEYTGHYSKVVYIGDGENDYCPCTLLTENDHLFPREDYALHNIVCKGSKCSSGHICEQVDCNVHPWKDGFTIIEILKKLL